MKNDIDASFGTKLFLHRIAFFLSRLIAIPLIPVVWIVFAPKIVDNIADIFAWLYFTTGMLIAIGPIVVFKYIVRLECPSCKRAKLDREVMGAGNYECYSCGFASS